MYVQNSAHTGGHIMSDDVVSLPAREAPVVADVDVLVCGGGAAGTAAAIGAARMGARTLLIERYNHLGGLATGGQVILLPPFEDEGRPVIGGIGMEMRTRMVDSGEADFRGKGRGSHFDPEALKSLSVDMLREVEAELLLHSWCAEAVMDDGRLRGVATLSKAGWQAFLAKMVVDTTGDLDLAPSAGAGVEKSDFGIGVPFRIGGVDIARWERARREEPEKTQAAHRKASEAGGWQFFLGLSPVPTDKTQHDVVWANNSLRKADGLDPAELTRIEIDGRDMARRAIEVLRAEMPGYERCWIIDVACQTGVRYTRRLAGHYVLTEEDVSQSDFRHPDSVARGNDFRNPKLVYDIPRQALVSRDVPNLLSAGRSLSCTHEALEPIREVHVCWTSGHGAGVVAGLAVRHGIMPAEVDIAEARAELRAQGAVVGGTDEP